jgi:hypothetical protein
MSDVTPNPDSELPEPLVGGTPLPGSKALEARVAPHQPTRINLIAVRSIFFGQCCGLVIRIRVCLCD